MRRSVSQLLVNPCHPPPVPTASDSPRAYAALTTASMWPSDSFPIHQQLVDSPVGAPPFPRATASRTFVHLSAAESDFCWPVFARTDSLDRPLSRNLTWERRQELIAAGISRAHFFDFVFVRRLSFIDNVSVVDKSSQHRFNGQTDRWRCTIGRFSFCQEEDSYFSF